MNNSTVLQILEYIKTLRNLQKTDPSINLTNRNANSLDNSIKALQRSIDAIEKYQYKIGSGKEAQDIFPGVVGKTTLYYIDQILKNEFNSGVTGIKELDNAPQEIKEKITTVSLLMKVQGIGPIKAENYFKLGIRTIDQLNQYLESSNSTGENTRQIIGSKYFNEFQKRIPREKVIIFADNFNKELTTFNKETGHNLIFDVMGSFKREEQTSGDIDILLYSDTDGEVSSCYADFINKLTQLGLLKETLSFGEDSYQGVGFIDMEMPSVRVDIKFIDKKSELPYAILYFTGSAKYNIYLRNVARFYGFTLGNNKMTNANGELIPAIDEGHIFHNLRLPYLPPNKRV